MKVRENNMAYDRNVIVNQAKAWIGRNEYDGSHRAIIDVYNAQNPLPRRYKVKYTDAWCATFVSAVALKCGYTRIIPCECSCEYMINKFKSIASWVENDGYRPNAGDIIFYDWDDNGAGDCTGHSDHVGVVESCSGNTIIVIEGNKNNKVERRTLTVNGRYIRGYGVPKYDVVKPSKSIETIAREVLSGKWGNGTDRKAAIEKAGYNYLQVQAKVNELVSHPNKKSIDEVAREVIRGKWGTGNDRKARLEKAGYDYKTVQARVNDLLR